MFKPVIFLILTFSLNLKKKINFQLVFKPVIFLILTFSLLAIFKVCFTIVLWLEIHDVFLRFFLLFNLATSAVTIYNGGVFKPTVHDLGNSGQ